ncbi:MAG: Hsp20/alpha crystallin family protein [Planctomycetaceae bacterium]
MIRPAVDVVKSAEAFTLSADLPGVGESDVDVTVEENVLRIRASAAAPQFEDASPLLSEYDACDYERRFTISDDVDRDHIDATLKDGVLTLTLPRLKSAGPVKIAIKSV